ncbi:Ger(x)C family spore germination protein [Paenibacillus polysaccharolyticus]|uniref:Ger(x)C family spore germination protein n=1 Tax=Paenibacillus polysaccharolyticus TaxID=582692 RepID=UPI0020412ED1|nr:Ger(x)C family spore germination protein [Paenibacillus polysaccharolyticus]MCM3132467.1 Ger(x)C family spore germination protein [Paenibacillus polysaccharolyticus]
MKKRMISACNTWLLICFCCTLLTGCWDRIEINDLAIVLATGVDYKNDQIELTSQIFIPRKAGGGDSTGSGGSPSGVTLTRSAEGHTIAEALNRLQRKVPRNMFWGHCEVVVISEDAGKQGIREYIDFFLRYPQIREHAYVFSTPELAKNMLALLDPLERSSAESLREMANMKLGTRTTILELAQSIEGPSESVILSRMLSLPPDEGQDKLTTTPYIRGLSLYKGDTFNRSVHEPLTIGILMLANELNNIIMPVNVESERGSFSIQPLEVKTILKPKISAGRWSMQVDVQTRGEVVLNTTDGNLTDPAVLKKLEETWASQLKDMAESALRLSQREMRTDLFKFAVEFRRYYPKQWKEQEKRWEQIYSELDVDIQIHAQVVRTGKSAGPQGIPDEQGR